MRSNIDEQWGPALNAWRADRELGLRGRWSWLSLSALVWLEEGENPVGGEAGASLSPWRQLPPLGILIVGGGLCRYRRETGDERILADDRSGAPDFVETDGIRFCIISRNLMGAPRYALRAWDGESPRRRDHIFAWFEGDPRWRMEAVFVDDPAEVRIPDALGGAEELESPGYVEFAFGGSDHRLRALDGGEGGLFIIFRDRTSGASGADASYPAARYLSAGPADSDGRLEIDFNRAVNPPCAYTAYATCPFSPEGNTLPFAVTAGEKWVRSASR
jgi:uncharacterized protein (DUF1684 family)